MNAPMPITMPETGRVSPVSPAILNSESIPELYQAWQTDRDWRMSDAGPIVDDDNDRAIDFASSIEYRIRDLPAATVADITIKCRLMMSWANRFNEDEPGFRLGAAILRDIEALDAGPSDPLVLIQESIDHRIDVVGQINEGRFNEDGTQHRRDRATVDADNDREIQMWAEVEQLESVIAGTPAISIAGLLIRIDLMSKRFQSFGPFQDGVDAELSEALPQEARRILKWRQS